MGDSRDFIVQRYCVGNWHQVLGERPFIATGPNFSSWVIPGSLEKYREWKFRPQLKQALAKLFPCDGIHRSLYHQLAVAEFLLRDGIVQALWATNGRAFIGDEFCWEESIHHVAREMSYLSAADSIADLTIDLLATMSQPSHFISYVSEDDLKLVPVEIPFETVD